MKASERLGELLALQDRAARLAEQVGAQLEAGTPPDHLIPLLREQAGMIASFQSHLAELAPEGHPEARARLQHEVDGLKATFEALVRSTEKNHRLAAKKGVRLTGIGSKPHTPRNRPQERASEIPPPPSGL